MPGRLRAAPRGPVGDPAARPLGASLVDLRSAGLRRNFVPAAKVPPTSPTLPRLQKRG